MPLLSNLRNNHPASRPAAAPSTPVQPTALPGPRDTIPEAIIKPIVDAEDSRPEDARSTEGFIHVTALFDACPRALQLARIGNSVDTRSVTGGHRIMWAIGRAVEAHIRNTYIRAVDYEGVMGHWDCNCGALTFKGFWQEHGACTTCGTKATNYRELALADPVAEIVGAPDLVLLRPGSQRLVVTEIKSITPNEFPDLTGPKLIHVLQAAAYNRLLRLEGFEVEPYVSVIYCNKQFQYGSPYKEFVRPVNSTVVQANLDSMWATAGALAQADGIIPRVQACTTPDGANARRARACPFVGECFMRGNG